MNRHSATSARIAATMQSSTAIVRASGRGRRRVPALVARHEDVAVGGAEREQRGHRRELARQHDAVVRRPQRVDAVELHHREDAAADDQRRERIGNDAGRTAPAQRPSPAVAAPRSAAAARRPRTRRRRHARTPTAASASCGAALLACPLSASARPTPSNAASDKPRATTGDWRHAASNANSAANSATIAAIAVRP